MAQRAIFFRQNSRWRVIAHRSQRFLGIFDHWGQNLFQFFDGIAGCDLAHAQFVTGKDRFFFDFGQGFVHFVNSADPVTEWLRCGKLIFDCGVVVQFTLGHIDSQ